VAFRAVFTTGANVGDHVLFRLPVIPTPSWYSGVQLGGAVSLEGTLGAAADGLRLAVLLCCIGAANTLANPKRALRVLPGALFELGVAVTVALSVAPQLVESLLRVRRARRLRVGGRSGRFRGLGRLLIPVLQDALARSLLLAAAMDSRGYGRVGPSRTRTRHVTAGLLLAGLLGLCAGAYGLLDASSPRWLGLPMMAGGAAICCAGLTLGGRRVTRTSYRPDRWSWPEWITVVCGLVPAIVLFASDTDLLPSFSPLAWPPLPVAAAIAIGVAVLPAIVAPPVPRARAAMDPPAPPARVAADRQQVAA
jgi:energy-coupling factor transport system permease protein